MSSTIVRGESDERREFELRGGEEEREEKEGRMSDHLGWMFPPTKLAKKLLGEAYGLEEEPDELPLCSLLGFELQRCGPN